MKRALIPPSFVFALAVVCLLAACEREKRTPPPAPPPVVVKADDIILITIDTLRADALGFAGNKAVETPFLDSLASRSIVFTNAHAHNVITLPSHANILTGLLPYEHGVRENTGFRLDPKIDTVAGLLQREGFATGAFVGAFPLDQRFGLNRGFDVYDDRYREGSTPLDFRIAERSAPEVLAAAQQWFDSQSGKRRFLWIHLYDPHAPYAPPEPFATRYRSRPYYGEVAAVDAALSGFLGPLLAKSHPLLIVTSDHGESLGEHGEATHGLFAYESTLHVPLVISGPGIGAAVDRREARHIDIAPTILSAVGVNPSPAMKGASLLSPAPADGVTYFESLSSSLNRGWAPLTGVLSGGRKLIALPIVELYNVTEDPREKRNIALRRRSEVTALRRLLPAAPAASPNRVMTDEERRALLALGYSSGSSPRKTFTAADDPKRLVHLDRALHDAVDSYQKGDLPAAIGTVRRVIRERPDMQAANEMLGFLLLEQEDQKASISVLQKAAAAPDASTSVKVRLALALSEAGRSEEAAKALEPLVAGGDPEILNAYGIALADSGRIELANQQFLQALKNDPTNATALQNLGVVALRSGDSAAARRHLEHALRLNDALPLALNSLAVVEQREGHPELAVTLWRRAVELDPRQYDALYNLGLVAGQNGAIDEAVKALDAFVRTAPRTRYREEIANARTILEKVRKPRKK